MTETKQRPQQNRDISLGSVIYRDGLQFRLPYTVRTLTFGFETPDYLFIKYYRSSKKSLMESAVKHPTISLVPRIQALHYPPDISQRLLILDNIFDTLSCQVLLSLSCHRILKVACYNPLTDSVRAFQMCLEKQALVRRLRSEINPFSPMKAPLLLLGLILILYPPVLASKSRSGSRFVYDSVLTVYCVFQRIAPTERTFINLLSLAIEAQDEQEWSSREIQEITRLLRVCEEHWHGN